MVFSLLANAEVHTESPGRMVERLHFGQVFHDARLEVPGKYEPRTHILCGGIPRDGFLLHPSADNDDTSLHIKIPSVPYVKSEGEQVLLAFYTGMQDEIRWDDKQNPPNGARFSLRIDEAEVLSEELHESRWNLHVIDLMPWQGKSDVPIRFGVNSIEGNPSFDWTHFAACQLLTVLPVPELSDFGSLATSPGVALFWVQSQGGATVRASCGEAQSTRRVAPGTTIVPVEYARADALGLEVIDGDARVVRQGYAAWPVRLSLVARYTIPEIIPDMQPFDIVARFRNEGPGWVVAPENISAGGLRWQGQTSDEKLASSPPHERPDDNGAPWRPGDERSYIWHAQGHPAGKSNGPDCNASITWRENVECVFPTVYANTAKRPEDLAPLDSFGTLAAHGKFVLPGTPFKFSLFMGKQDALLEFADAKSVLGTIPLAGKVYFDGNTALDSVLRDDTLGAIPPYALTRDGWFGFNAPKSDFQSLISASPKEHGVELVLEAFALQQFQLELDSPVASNRLKVRLQYILGEAEGGGDPPRYMTGIPIIFGDRNPASRRDFALFPGLEFLEGDEGSSSTRDLAPPLNERAMPGAYKITAPFMAVVGNDSLVGVMWNSAVLSGHANDFAPARFEAPAYEPGKAIFRTKFPLSKGLASTPLLEEWLVFDDRAAFEARAQGQDTSRAAFVLDMYRHYVEVFGLPAPSPQPRGWDEEKALCADGYLNAVGSADPPGFRHCAGWDVGAYTAHAVPARLLLRDGLPDEVGRAIGARVDAVVARAVKEQGGGALASNAGAHIVNGETPFLEGYVGESLCTIRDQGFQWLDKREDGLWKWHPGDARSASLGKDGDHTLGQAALGARIVLRAARLSGNVALRAQALDALKILEQYAVPRGAQTWECPLYQPDLLAAAHAISAYMDAYQLTGDQHYIEQATYWAKTGLPFIYLWSPTGHPAMLYNTIPVFGSTWFTHSWIGLPVVWCGLVYAYALQDLAPYDNSFDWRTIAQGITNSAMHQQYTDGPSKGCYPDSWNVIAGTPNPADINPENIVLNECRLRGNSAEVRTRRVPGRVGEALINSAFELPAVLGEVGRGKLGLVLHGKPGFPGYTAIVPAQDPAAVEGAGQRAADSAALAKMSSGWLYDREAQALILKHTPTTEDWKSEITW